jgi:hypothetical protein
MTETSASPDRERRQKERRAMTPGESVDTRLARIEEHILNIDDRLKEWVECRHVLPTGYCEFLPTVQETERVVNQWRGAIGVIAVVCTLLGTILGYVVMKVLK